MAPAPGPSSRRLLYGTDEALEETTTWRAGALRFTLREGAIGPLRCGGDEVWHGLTFPVRDAGWWTPPFTRTGFERRGAGEGLDIEVRGRFDHPGRIDTVLRVRAGSGEALSVEATAVCRDEVRVNRLGLCLLLPSAQGGAPCRIVHDDGRESRSTLPELIPPWPPFTGIREFHHEYAPGLHASVRFDGESFEFEDQRNNADASFKIYSRSNFMPRPYVLPAGTVVRQAISLGIDAPARSRSAPATVRRAPAARTGRMPALRLAVSPNAGAGAIAAVARTAPPDRWHLMLGAGTEPGPGLIEALARDGRPVDVDLSLGPADRPAEAIEALAARLSALPLGEIAVFPTTPAHVLAARRRWPTHAIGGGTTHFFAQINRAEALGPVDFLSYTVSPLVHGADDASIMESPASLAGMEATLRRRFPGIPLRLGPSAIAMRASPLGDLPADDGARRQAMGHRDPRVRGLFGAAWMLRMVIEAAAAGFEAATLLAVDGPSAIRAEDDEPVWRPAAALLARLAGRPGAPVDLPDPSTLVWRDRTERISISVNATPHPVPFDRPPMPRSLAFLDEAALAAAWGSPDLAPFRQPASDAPLELSPYGIAVSCLEAGG